MSLLNKNIRWQIPALAATVLAVHVFVLYSFFSQSIDIALTDGIVSVGLLALAVWAILLLINSYPTGVGILLYALIITTVISLAVMYATWFVLKLSTNKGDIRYLSWLFNTISVRFIVNWLICGWIATYVAMTKKSDELESKYLQQSDASVLLKEAELHKLRLQLQPHFLYNSLNSISALTMIAPDRAQEMIGRLSDFLRTSVKREAQDRIPIDEELAYIEAYLAIESIRFGDRLVVAFEKEYTDDATIPPFLLQPVLENAIKFGLYGKTGKVEISIHISLNDSMLTITINNPYDTESTPPTGTGFGLKSIQRRLYLIFARADLLETEKNDESFTTILKIPQTHV